MPSGLSGPSGGAAAYDAKAAAYFAGSRADYVAQLPDDPAAAILEIGCGDGSTGALALARGKCGEYVGIELHAPSAAVARTRLTRVIEGNAETLEMPFPPAHFDALIMSEVLEHLVDPWALVARLVPHLKPGARVFASSPNIAHHRILRMLIRGDWTLADSGPMDRTHLRWFTPRSYARLFEDCGLRVEAVGPVAPPGPRARVLDALTGGRMRHLLMRQISIRARKPPA